MSFGRANSKHIIRPTWTDTPLFPPPKQHGAYAFTHPANGDPTAGRDPTDAFYEGIKLRAWHGQQSVSGEDLGIGRHHPPILCAVTSPHMFGTAFLVNVNDASDAKSHGEPVPCLLMPHRVIRGLEHDFQMMAEELDIVTRVVPPSTHSAPGKDEFYIVRLEIDPWRYFSCSPMPTRGMTQHDENHMDYVLFAVKNLPPEIPNDWIRNLEEAAQFGYHPAPNALNIFGCAPRPWLDPSLINVGKAAVGINWRAGKVSKEARVLPSPRVSENERNSTDITSGRVPGIGFISTFEGLPPAPSCAGGAVLACMLDETARSAGTRNSMAADTRFAASVRPFSQPPRGYGDWGVLVGMHRGGSTVPGESDILRVTDIVRDLRQRRAASGRVEETAVASEIASAVPEEPSHDNNLNVSHSKHVSWDNEVVTESEAQMRRAYLGQ